ncbi:MAG: 50S ribosomal protein L21 [Chloroflexi bacterium]|nr:50S ribosomal protein L21 [Chloroflexota bacterium]
MYAVIRAGGKQYRVERDQLLDVDLMEGGVGSTVELKDVLLIANKGDVSVGMPVVDGAVVEAEIIEHGKGPKLRIFKYKNKTRYRRRMGHRTQYTRLAIGRILQNGVEVGEGATKPKAKRALKDKTAKAAEVAAETQIEAPTDAPAETKEKPKRAPRKTTRKKATEIEASVEAPASEPPAETAGKPKRATRKRTKEATSGAEASVEPKKPVKRRASRAEPKEDAEEEKSTEDQGS